ncbi:hypothetical protein ZYGR_0P00690 [Zygosaccharomyces rouxii]|uniref:GATA-type domain-containing protein n=1 Tax=Zygosaccharomyces rouxii TaxID=4956 RepID=A0A1Q3A151_ZYGRO|nr:hypothetical protein ZYGR_0P00690 [Zygosaccharomyces rouxii]
MRRKFNGMEHYHWIQSISSSIMTTETAETNVACKNLCNDAKGAQSALTLPTPPPLQPPPPTPTSTRANSTPVPPNSVIFQVVNRDNSSSLTHGFTPRVVPEFNSSTHGAVRNSAIRSTLNRETTRSTPAIVGHVRHASAPSAMMERSVPSRDSVFAPSPPSRKPISDLLKIAKYMDDRGRNDLEDHEKDAALALLVLKECSRQVFGMSKGWSNLDSVPLCDFVVAQRKCQTMLNSIENLKEMKIQARDTNGDVQISNAVEKPSTREKNVKFHEESYKSRSSSVVSIVNVTTPLPEAPSAQREKAIAPRSSSMSSERTLTYSPLSSDRSTPTPVPLEKNNNNNYSPYRPSSSPNTKSDSVFISLSDDDRKHMGKIGKTSKSGKNRNAHMRCLHCSSTETPEWRKGPSGPTTLCNACGLFYKKLIKKFGEEVATSIMKSRQTEDPQNRKIPRFARL